MLYKNQKYNNINNNHTIFIWCNIQEVFHSIKSHTLHKYTETKPFRNQKCILHQVPIKECNILKLLVLMALTRKYI